MDWRAVFVIAAMVGVTGALIYLPFFIWFRWKGKRRTTDDPRSLVFTKAGVGFYAFMVFILLAGLGMGVMQPTSWLGAQVRTALGGIGYAMLVWLSAEMIARGLAKIGVVLVYQVGGSGGNSSGETPLPAVNSQRDGKQSV